MIPRHALEMIGVSDPGIVRPHNEDCIAMRSDQGIAILADGMGGYNAGEVASAIAVSTILDDLRAELKRISAKRMPNGMSRVSTIIHQAVEKANNEINQIAFIQPQCHGMGTTLVLAVFYDNRVTVGHVGDSRLYRLRRNRFEQITRDHSLLQEQIDSGIISEEEAKFSQNKNLVTRALGIEREVEIELHEYEALPGDIYLLCSDGLPDMVEDEQIQDTIKQTNGNLSKAAQQLVKTANEKGGRDNISVILARVTRPFPASELSWRDRLF